MREVRNGMEKETVVNCLDGPGAGGACHEYVVLPAPRDEIEPAAAQVFAEVHFQNGPIGEAGPNGCQNENLLSIVIDRLQSFQAGPFKCDENAVALNRCEEALMWLNKRTADRRARGVEGKMAE